MSTEREEMGGTTLSQKKTFMESSSQNPKPQEVLPPGDADHGTQGDKLVIAMVGLPARGKTYIANKLQRYLSFFHGAPTQVFNVGNYRRKMFGSCVEHDFFDHSNPEGVKARRECSHAALEDLKKFISSGMEKGRVAIFDATNNTRTRRQWLIDELSPILQSKSHIIFVESVCEDENMVENNIRATKLSMPDYQSMEPDVAVADFKKRIAHYMQHYEPLSDQDKEYSWIKTVNGGQQVVLNKIFGYLPGRIASFVMNLHTSPKMIYLTRHGQSEYNLTQKIGGDSSLTAHGEEYATALAAWVHKNILVDNPRARLWTSTLKRTIETGKHIRHDEIMLDGQPWIVMRPREWHALDEIHAGIFDGMTYAEIEAADPEEFAMRKKDKLGYRYPRGESYLDVFQRLDTIIHELERQRDHVLIIAHQGILRILLGYLMWNEVKDREECPHISIPLNTIKCLKPHAYGCTCDSLCLLKKEAGPDGQTEPCAPDPPSH
ncbi:hypothetical protein GUITHDRAFT_161860 [Guillardia theta CCMP2712]|uniref:6-phosphofructo-2-kinase domain-containing protein n=1 Tax=Guillardia theta (strain CCMP2712) TaxID=905079 RepID=L1JQT9_GUITC|nr:hypothetical protein GUITHDRAFT_161860 [Guillardia theta CCMP2712]EKX50659.1 hypothetical protein GUITHDRAFT_161860 [Guillardia theta CCMP2712]|eukprot:XP_005837639.1 hypothetical protein GUITHDRAFT_161860 [Guillardia theta CCMP2712]